MPDTAVEFVHRFRGRGESIDFKSPNSFFSSVPGVLDSDVPFLGQIHQPAQGLNSNWFQSKSYAHYYYFWYLVALVFHPVIASGGNNSDGPHFEELFLECGHAGAGDRDALIHRHNPGDLNEM